MQVNRIQSTNPNFGMAITGSKDAYDLLARRLTKRGVRQFNKLVEQEKTNPREIILTTEKRKHYDSNIRQDVPYQALQAKVVGNETYEWNGLRSTFKWIDSFRIIKTIKSAVKRARNLTKLERN